MSKVNGIKLVRTDVESMVFRSFVSGHSEFEIWPRRLIRVCVFCFLLLFNYSCAEGKFRRKKIFLFYYIRPKRC